MAQRARPARERISDPLRQIFPGDSEMARRMRAFDWASSPVGPPETWPENLRVALGICLTSRFPLTVWWGPDLTNLYNDADIAFLGEGKHPAMLGRSCREAWSEIWHIIGPMIERVRTTGEASWSEDVLMHIDRAVPEEEIYATFSFSPVLGSDGQVGGIFCAASEVTGKIIGSRRLETLRKLGQVATEAHTAEAACKAAVRTLGDNPHDIPFAAVYGVDDKSRAILAASSGWPCGWPALPRSVECGDDCAFWRLLEVLNSKRRGERELGQKTRPSPARPAKPMKALVLPIPAAGQESLTGVLVVGTSPHRPLDSGSLDFFDLVAGHIGRAVAAATAREAERRRAEALAEIDRAKTAFFSNVSHEFRTPITLMLGPLEEALSDRESPLPKDHVQRLMMVNRNAGRLLKLVNTLLDFSRIEAGRITACYRPTDLAALTIDLASMFRPACERGGLRLVVRCPRLPEPVYVDQDMWEKIVLNLLSNAVKHTFEGEIRVALARDGPAHVRLEVSDTGSGIPESDLPHIFERFHRVAGACGRTFEGTGIGLSLVRELVALHGGAISAESRPGCGSTFRVRVPLGAGHLDASRLGPPLSLPGAPARAEAYVQEVLSWLPAPADVLSARPPAASGEPATPDSARRFRVLVADDNADMRDYLRSLLHPGADVTLVADGQQAIAALDAAHYDLLLADVMMPRLDGFALLRHVRSDPTLRFLAVILLSARAGEEARAEALRGGADDYLVKPFVARELVGRIGSCLALARKRTETLADSERRERLLTGELQSRVNNILAMVRTTAFQTLATSTTLADFYERFEGRMNAVGRAQQLLIYDFEEVGLSELIENELTDYGGQLGQNVSVDGPEVRLRPKAVLVLSMAMHELVVNAVKFGALAPGAASGRVAVAWAIEPPGAVAEPPRLILRWAESGVAEIDPEPLHRGHGRMLLEEGLPRELPGAETQFDFHPGGLRCMIVIPLRPETIGYARGMSVVGSQGK